MPIWTSETQVIAKRKVESQIGTWCEGNVWHTVGKLSTRAITLLQNSLQLKVFTPSYAPPKSWKSQMWKFRDSHLGVLRQKAIWMWPPWKAAEYTIRGKVMASLKSGPWWVLWVRACPWFVVAPKVFPLCINHLMLGLCTFVWVIEACQFFLVSSRSSSTPLYPSKCCEPGSSPNSLLFRCFQFETHIWVPQGVGSASMHI